MKVLESKSYIASPPGETINEVMEDRAVTNAQLADLIGENEEFVRQLMAGDIDLTEDLANRIEKAINIPAYFLLNLERFYRDDLAKVAQENAQAVTYKATRASKREKKKGSVSLRRAKLASIKQHRALLWK